MLIPRVRARIPVVQLPDQVTAVRKKKQDLKRRYLVRTENAETGKWLVSGGLVVAALVTVHIAAAAAPLAVGGAVLFAVDP